MIDLHIWDFPLSLILALVFILCCVLCFGKTKGSKLLMALSGRNYSARIMAVFAILVAIEGTWKFELFHSWGFAAVVLMMMFPLCLVTGNDVNHKYWNGIFSHLGLVIVLLAGFFGAADVVDTQMQVDKETANHISYSSKGEIVPLPFEIKLEDFRTDYYEDGISPKQYTSILDIDGKRFTTSVNHPCKYKGYSIYQADYDRRNGEYSVLKLVRDPWLPLVYLGFALLAVAAVLEVKRVWNSKAVLPVILVLAVAFSFISLAKINFGTLMPALRSLWFVPHLIIYMLAYSILAIALICSIIAQFTHKLSDELPYRLLVTASSLLLLGMLCGAVWAKAAWGDYWTWDGKECWAAVTWLLTLVGTHTPRQQAGKRLLVFILLSFLAMQITWYGVNYLPSSQYSLHTYNNQ